MKHHIVILLAIISVSGFVHTSSSATDLTPQQLITSPDPVKEKSEVTFTVKVGNINIQDASPFSIRLRIFASFDTTGTATYDETINSLSIPKNSTKNFTFPNQFEPTILGKRFYLVEVFYYADIDLSNNKLFGSFDVLTWDNLNVNDAFELMIARLQVFFPITDSARQTLAILPGPLPAGTKIKSYDPNELNITLSANSWLGWYRNDKYDRYSSVNGVVVLGDKDSSSKFYPTEWWININDTPITEKLKDSMYKFGTPPTVPTIDSASIHTSTSGTGDGMECAILISGKASDAREQWAFNSDLDIVDVNLRLEKLGPHLQAKNIYILYAPSPDQIVKLFDSLRGKCKKLWFFYSGHGDSLKSTVGNHDPFGYMVTRDSNFAYWELFNNLFASGAEETTVLIDACHSGVAVEELRKDSRAKDHNINLVTACQTGETSTTFFIGQDHMTGFGAFTLYWFKCFGEPAAEWDGIPGISEQEATDWLRIVNPEMPNETRLLDNFHPRWYFHRVGQEFVKDTPAPMPQTSVTVTLREGTTTKPLSVSVTDPGPAYIDAPTQALKDSSVNGLSYERMWEFNYQPKTGLKYSFDLEFQTVPGIDSFPNGGTPGILHREDSSKPWSVYAPYQYLPLTKSIKAIGVDGFSQWVMASVSKPQAAVSQSLSLTNLSLCMYPNPAHTNAIVRMVLTKTEEIELVIYDALAKPCLVVADGSFPAGDYKMPVSVGTLSPGTYLLQLSSKNGMMIASAKFQIIQ